MNPCLVRRSNRNGHVLRSSEIAAIGGRIVTEDTVEHPQLLGPDGDAVRISPLPSTLRRLPGSQAVRIVSTTAAHDDRLGLCMILMHRRVPDTLLPAPGWLEVWSLVLLAGFYLVADAFVGESSYAIVNLVGPLSLSVILARGAWGMLRRDPKLLWTALMWFRLSTIVFFGIGTCLVFMIDMEGRQYVESFFWFFDQDVFKMNLIVTVGVLLVLASARFAVRIAERWLKRFGTGNWNETDNQRSLIVTAVGFLAVCLAVDYMVKLPYDLGWMNVEMPGSFMNLSRLKLVGFFLITIWALKNGRWLLPAITGLVLFDLLRQTLLFAKSDVLIALLTFLLAFLWEKAGLKRLAVSGALVISAFVTLQPLVGDGRRELEVPYGETQVGLLERAEILHAYFTDERLPESRKEGASALTRLTYVNAATLVITRYDAGQPGDWPTLLPAVFVPRLFWPDKPIITDVGRDIYELGTGRRSSQSGAGVFADAYWAMGWWGVLLFMPIYGIILGVLTESAAKVVREGRWLYFPVVVLALRIGLRTDGHYLSDVAGSTVILAGTFACLWALSTLTSWFRLSPAVPMRTVC
jgi:hypothetical protein